MDASPNPIALPDQTSRPVEVTGRKPAAPKTARGMRDLMPLHARRRQHVAGTLRRVFEGHGFEPVETPAVELESTLMGKYGPDAERLIYRASLAGEDGYALRYDLSVPLARLVAGQGQLRLPFRRYQIASQWRGERPQRGRYREFVQADVDIVGSDSVIADAEIVQILIVSLDALGLGGTVTKLNDRRLLNGIGRYAGVPEALLPGLYRAIDKLDKLGPDGVREQLLGVGLPGDLLNRQRQAMERQQGGKADRATLLAHLGEAELDGLSPILAERASRALLDSLSGATSGPAEARAARAEAMAHSLAILRAGQPQDALVPATTIDRMLGLLSIRDEPRALLDGLDRRLGDVEARAGSDDLRRMVGLLDAVGIAPNRYEIDMAMVRGLAYYNRSIFETVVPDPPIGSISGGGRYDGLIGLFGRDLPAVGSSLGVDRLVDVLESLGGFDDEALRPPSMFVTAFGEAELEPAARRAALIRRAGLPSILTLEPGAGLGSQLRSADRLGCRWALIAGPDEAARGEVLVKDLSTGEQYRWKDTHLAMNARALGGDGERPDPTENDR